MPVTCDISSIGACPPSSPDDGGIEFPDDSKGSFKKLGGLRRIYLRLFKNQPTFLPAVWRVNRKNHDGGGGNRTRVTSLKEKNRNSKAYL